MWGFGDDQSVWGHLVQAWDWFLHLLTPANLIQIPAVILAGAAAWLLTKGSIGVRSVRLPMVESVAY
jgi:uncharacterized membrane protein SpoIIM required for sporulation